MIVAHSEIKEICQTESETEASSLREVKANAITVFSRTTIALMILIEHTDKFDDKINF